jgi:hypothetical protein
MAIFALLFKEEEIRKAADHPDPAVVA